MLTRQQKEEAVSVLRETFQRTKGMVITDYKGMSVESLAELRDELRKSGLEYKVVKNTLARIATEGTEVEAAKDYISGPVGLAISFDDPAEMAKILLNFEKENENFEVKGGVVDGSYCDAGQLKVIASLPSRDVMLGTMAGTFQAPTTKMARLLQATVVRFAYALNAVKEKKEAA